MAFRSALVTKLAYITVDEKMTCITISNFTMHGAYLMSAGLCSRLLLLLLLATIPPTE